MKWQEINWVRIARRVAKDAHLNCLHLRRGVLHLKDIDVLVMFNNNPYALHPTLRDEELAEFRKYLSEKGIHELGFATYPKNAYTYALVIDASQDREKEVNDKMAEIVRRNMGRM